MAMYSGRLESTPSGPVVALLRLNRRASTKPESVRSSGMCVLSYHLLYSSSWSGLFGRVYTTNFALGMSTPAVCPSHRTTRTRTARPRSADAADLAQPVRCVDQTFVETDGVVPEPLVRLRRLQVATARPCRRRLEGDRHQGRAEDLEQLRIVRRRNVLDPVVNAGQGADPVARRRRAHHVLWLAVEHVALAGYAPVEGQDASACDVLGEHPADREGQISRHAPSERRLEDPVEAGPAERVARHGRGTEDGARVRAHDILPGGCPRHGVLERRHLCDGVGIRAWLLGHRGVLAFETAARVEERARADGDHPAHAESLGRIEDVLRPLDVHGLEVGEVLAGATQERGTVDHRVSAGCGTADVVGDRDVATDDL